MASKLENVRITIEAGRTKWELVCEGKRVGDMIAAGIEKMEEEYGRGTTIQITAVGTDDPVDC